MHGLITRLFEKRGIKHLNDMSPDERKTFEQWNGILSKEALAVSDIEAFCRSQISVIEARWRDMEAATLRNERLIAQHVVYRTLLDVIASPKREREQLERQLEDMIKQ